MNIDLIVKIFGVLGFFISIATFILTRLEKRKRIVIDLSFGVAFEFEEGGKDNDEELIKIRFTNLGSRPVILRPFTFKIEANGKTFMGHEGEYLGEENFKELIPPTTYQELGINREYVISKLGLDAWAPDKYDDESLNKLFPMKLSVKDHENTVFVNKKYKYHEAVGEFVT